MKVSIDQKWETFVDEVVSDGRYASADVVLNEALRLFEERERKLADLRATIEASLARGGENSDDEVAAAVEDALNTWEGSQAA